MDKIRKIEDHVKAKTANVIAHDFKHVDRVRQWALKIAKAEGYDDLVKVEAAALLHDIGRGFKGKDLDHAQIGAVQARIFLQDGGFFKTKDIDDICQAIKYHNRPISDEFLVCIIRDADRLDLMGAMGLIRGIAVQAGWPEYDVGNIKGETWQKDFAYFKARFDQGKKSGEHILDQLNFQISTYQMLKTKTAKKIAKPLIKFMQDFIMQLEKEITMKVD